ncbi:hypothetical protein BKA67DRAFT_644563 [Truncatella angustata]|uniref:Uncharacterized protein n=1 Tax=Truncatella angustata TaxID=152316 RepID=A0A9P8UMU7_9PEZI|nr:uncharacterized protein BKA67DRAFT_644563 [Truncatella angustata]KAH6655002.1 hypothetical protein BKA67DRAFT_644563 [Truncatella angustata]KAH8204093.1 hypothetical protein TruAng_001775 [Truncatella angustata]
MLDIYWADHKRERVGDRKIRKEREEQEAKAKVNEGDGKKHESLRSSVSITSSASSEKAFGLFSNKGRRKLAASSSFDYTTGPPLSPTESPRGRSEAAHGVNRLLSHKGTSETSKPHGDGACLPVQQPQSVDVHSSPSPRDSIFSKRTQLSLATASTLDGSPPRNSVSGKSEHVMQTLGPSSFVVKTTQVMVAPRSMDCDIDHLVSEVNISSDRIKAPMPPSESIPEEGTPMPFDGSDSALLLTRLSQTPPPLEALGVADRSIAAEGILELSNLDPWKPHHQWDRAQPQDIPGSFFEKKTQSPAASNHYISPNLSALQREIHMMAAASPELMLANLRSEMFEASDSRVYKELEMTKKRWMFSALHYGAKLDQGSFIPGFQKSSRVARVLAIYETHASATFLAALYPAIKIYHLSPSPISPNLFPNIQPILVPAITVTAASRPLPPQLFSSVICLSMPSLFSSMDIPPLLRNVHRCLSGGGALHLMIVDPEPVPSSMGPKLRQWLIENLLTNLEQTFRTTLPSRTLPTWLAVSRLRGKGSTIMSLSIPAVSESFAKIRGVKDPGPVKAELRCETIRMLWREVWGSFVHAKRWWWEEEEILEECAIFGTYWVYSHVIAVKED